MKILKYFLSFFVCFFAASVLFGQVAQDSAILDAITRLTDAYKDLAERVPGTIQSPEDMKSIFTTISGLIGVLGTYIFRNSEKVIGFISKIKSNGILSIGVGVIVSLLGVTIMKGEDPITLPVILNFFSSTIGWSTFIYILTNALTGNKAKTPKAGEVTAKE